MRHLLVGYSYVAPNGKLFTGSFCNIFNQFPTWTELLEYVGRQNDGASDAKILSISEMAQADYLTFIEQK